MKQKSHFGAILPQNTSPIKNKIRFKLLAKADYVVHAVKLLIQF